MKLDHVTIRTRDLQATRSFFLLESSPQVRTRQRWERMMSRTVTELLVGVLEQVRAIKHTDIEDRTSTETTTSARMGVGSWIILIVLLSLLVAIGVVIYLGWTLGTALTCRPQVTSRWCSEWLFRWPWGSVRTASDDRP
jgi:hypothetical protein